MMNTVDMKHEDLKKRIIQSQSSDVWRCLEEIIKREIEDTRNKLEIMPDQIMIARAQSKIKTLRFILTLSEDQPNL